MAQPKEGSLVHVEIHSNDPVRTKQFYGNVFGWKFTDVPEMNYILWTAPKEPGGGLQHHGGRGPHVLDYLYSDNIDATLRRVSAAGGTVLQTRMEIPGQGWWAMFQEPGGTVMALYQALQRPRPARKPARKAGAKKSKARSRARKKK